MTTPTVSKKLFCFGDVSCAELPVSDYLFKYSRYLHGTSDRLQIGLVFYNKTLKCVASTVEIHKFRDKH